MSDEPSAPALPEGFLADYESAATDNARWKVVTRYFDLQKVATNHDLRPATHYLLQGEETRVLASGGDAPNVDPVPMTVVPSGETLEPMSRKTLLTLGKQSQVHKLRPRLVRSLSAGLAAIGDHGSSPDEGLADADEKSAGRLVRSVDISAFSHLLAAVQQSGLISTADQIARARDVDFRDGRYDTAFDTIERIYVAFRQAADHRMQQLMDEEMRFRSGALKMSPKQWQLKKQRDTAQTQVIERARRSFIRVLDGLRGLAPPETNSE